MLHILSRCLSNSSWKHRITSYSYSWVESRCLASGQWKWLKNMYVLTGLSLRPLFGGLYRPWVQIISITWKIAWTLGYFLEGELSKRVNSTTHQTVTEARNKPFINTQLLRFYALFLITAYLNLSWVIHKLVLCEVYCCI